MDNPEQGDPRIAEGGEMSRGVVIGLAHPRIAFVLMSLGALAWGQEKCPVEKTHDVEAGAFGVAFSPDGSRMAVGGSIPSRTPGSNFREGVVLILESSTGKEWKRHHFSGIRKTPDGRGQNGTQNHVRGMRFSPDGKHLAVADEWGVHLWTPDSGNPAELDLTDRGPSLSFSPDGKLLACGSGDTEGIRLWDVETRKARRVLKEGRGPVAFSQEGNLLASAGDKSRLCLWDLTRGERVAEVPRASHRLHGLAFAPDGRSLAVVDDSDVRIFSVATLDGKPSLKERMVFMRYSLFGVRFVEYAPNGRWLATSGGDGSLKVWDAATGRQLATAMLTAERRPFTPAFSPDSKRLAAVVPRDFTKGDASKLMLWNLDEILAPEAARAREKEAVSEMLRLAEAGKNAEAHRQLSAVGSSPETGVPLLIEGLKSAHPQARALAILALGMHGEAARSAVPEIRKLLTDENDLIRVGARETLEKIEPKK